MSWQKFIAWTKKIRRSSSQSSQLDYKLVRRIRHRAVPRWSQIKYLPQFLSRSEKRLVMLCLCLALVSLLGWCFIFLAHHITTTPGSGGEYTEAIVGQPKYINPLFASANDVDADISTLIFNGLVQFDAAHTITPLLAERYTISDDGKTYDVFIRPNIHWSDGELLTADDVLFTFEAIQNPEVNSPLASAFQGVKIEKIAPNHVRFTLKVPFAPFINSLTTGIIPEHIWSDIPPTAWKLAKNNLQPIGTGPWVFSKLTKDNLGNIQSYSLTRNDDFFGVESYLKTVTFRFFSDESSATEALRSGSVLAWSFVPSDTKSKLPKTIATYTLNLPEYRAIFFNSAQQPTLSDSDLRKALALAIDKVNLVTTTLHDGGYPIDAPLLPGMLGFDPAIVRATFDPVAANQLLDKKWTRLQPEQYFKIKSDAMLAAKKPKETTSTKETAAVSSSPAVAIADLNTSIRQEMNPGQTFYRQDKNGTILTLTITTADTPEYQAVAEFLANSWRALGIQIKIDYLNGRQIGRERIKERAYDILLYGEIVGSDPDLYPFWHSSQSNYPGLNLSGYSNKDADKFLEDARVTIDVTKRAALYRKFQEQLISDLPAIFLYAPSYTFAASKSLHGVALGASITPADRYADLANWYLKTSWGWKK